jgi:ribosomal protein eL8
MGKAAFVKFETPRDLENKVLEAVAIAKATGKVRRGVNEATKAIERGIAKLVVMAEDVTPEEVLMHVPVICEEKQVPYAYAASKIELGKASGIDVPTSAIAIIEEGDSKKVIADVVSTINGLKGKKE